MGSSDRHGSFNFVALSDPGVDITTATDALVVDSERIGKKRLNVSNNYQIFWLFKIDEVYHPRVGLSYLKHRHGWCKITDNKFNVDGCS